MAPVAALHSGQASNSEPPRSVPRGAGGACPYRRFPVNGPGRVRQSHFLPGIWLKMLGVRPPSMASQVAVT